MQQTTQTEFGRANCEDTMTAVRDGIPPADLLNEASAILSTTLPVLCAGDVGASFYLVQRAKQLIDAATGQIEFSDRAPRVAAA